MPIINTLKTLTLATTITMSKATFAYSVTYFFNSYAYEPLANAVSEYAKEWGLYEYKTSVFENIYNVTRNNLSPEIADFSVHLAKNSLPALKDAILLDGIVSFTLGGPILYPIIGSTIAYALRKSINGYFENSKLHEVTGGVVAGAIKYGISKSTLNGKILFIGAVNNALYEYFKPEVGATINNADMIGLYTSLTMIEGVDAVLKFAQTYIWGNDAELNVILNINNLLGQIATTLKVTGLVSASIWIFLEDKDFYCNKTQCFKKGIEFYTDDMCYIDERYKGEFAWTPERTLSIPNKVIDDIAYAVNYVMNSQKPTPDMPANEEANVNSTFDYYNNTKAQCILKNFTQLDTCSADEYYDELVQNTELNSKEVEQDVKEEL